MTATTATSVPVAPVTMVEGDEMPSESEFVATLADEVFVAHAAPGSKTEHFCSNVLAWGNPLLTLEGDENADLIARGARPVKPEGIGGCWKIPVQ